MVAAESYNDYVFMVFRMECRTMLIVYMDVSHKILWTLLGN